MALNTCKFNHLMPLHFEGLTVPQMSSAVDCSHASIGLIHGLSVFEFILLNSVAKVRRFSGQA